MEKFNIAKWKREVPSIHHEKLGIMLRDGKKGEGDKIIEICTFNTWHRISFMELMKIIKLFFENEDRVYGYALGRMYLYNAITDLKDGYTLDQIREKYLKKDYKETKELY